jgi:hypothetical protein
MTMTTVAAAMQRLAAHNGVAKHKLQRGLALVLRQAGRQRTLAAGRIGVYPSDKEIEIITLAFGVPAGSEAQRSQMRDAHKRNWSVLTWTWIEVEQPRQAALLPPAAAYP